MTQHYDEEALLSGLLSADLQIARHIADCAECRRVAEELRAIVEGPALAPPSDTRLRAFRRITRALAAAGEFGFDYRRPATPATIQSALQTIQRHVTKDPRKALDLCLPALFALAELEEEDYSPGLILAFKGDISKLRGQAMRQLGRYSDALQAYDDAEEYYRRTPTSDLNHAVLDLCRAIVLQELESIARALDLVERAMPVFIRYGDERRLTQARLVEGNLLYLDGKYARSALLFRKILETSPEPATAARVRLNLAQALQQIGDYDQASSEMKQAMEQFSALAMTSESHRAEWNLARLEITRGEWTSAKIRLFKVRQQFEELGLFEEAGLVSIDLVECYIDREPSKAEAFVHDAIRYFRGAGLESRVSEALGFLLEATRKREEQAHAARHVRSFVEAAVRGSRHSFQPPAPLT